MMPVDQHADNARALLARYRQGQASNGIKPEDCGPYAGSLQAIEAEVPNGIDAVKAATALQVKRHPDFKTIVEPPGPRYVVRWLGEALEPQPPIEWIVDRLFPEASLSLLFGKPGCKKTWLALSMALSVASGRAWLGRKTTQATALVIDEESGQRRLSRRIGALARGVNAAPDTPLAYVSLARFNFTDVEDVHELHRLVDQLQARFVVIDTLAATTAGIDENAVKEMQPVLSALRKVAEETGAALVVLHHENKAGGFRGSTSIAGAVDHLIRVEADADNGNVALKSEKVRDVEEALIHAHLSFHEAPDGTAEKVLVGVATYVPPPPSFGAGERFALSYLAEHGTATTTQIKAAADEDPQACAGSTARKGVFNLVADGYASRTDLDGSGNEATFALTPTGKEYASQLRYGTYGHA